jgi:hypothetical protein
MAAKREPHISRITESSASAMPLLQLLMGFLRAPFPVKGWLPQQLLTNLQFDDALHTYYKLQYRWFLPVVLQHHPALTLLVILHSC